MRKSTERTAMLTGAIGKGETRVRRLSVVGLVLGLLLSSTSVLAQGSAPRHEGTIVASAVRAVATLQTEAEEPARRRSMARTWTGVALIGGGAAIAVAYGGQPSCVTERAPGYYYEACNYDSDDDPALMVGSALAAVGLLLATMWSDVPANAIEVSVAPGRVRVGKTFGF